MPFDTSPEIEGNDWNRVYLSDLVSRCALVQGLLLRRVLTS